MKRVHLLAVDAPAQTFAGLFAAAREEGLHLGWLEPTPSTVPEPVPPGLAGAAAAGARQAVGVGGGRLVAVKPLAGTPVLADLLRGHFLGCVAVLVRGDLAAGEPLPRLDPAPPVPGTWRVTVAGGARTLTSAEVVARLRRPRPWD